MRTRCTTLLFAVLIAAVGGIAHADVAAPATQPATAGVLEFHILAFDVNDPNYGAMYDRMKPGGQGPAPRAGDIAYRWYEVDRPDQFDKPGSPTQTVQWNDKHYILLMITPDGSMTSAAPWALQRVYPTADNLGRSCVGFQFDADGTRLFGALTTRWEPKEGHLYKLAVVLNDKILSAPNLMGAITDGSGIIDGGGNGFSAPEEHYIIDSLNGATVTVKP